jgi:hypothetical protein
MNPLTILLYLFLGFIIGRYSGIFLELAKRIKGDVTQLSNRGVNENSKKR